MAPLNREQIEAELADGFQGRVFVPESVGSTQQYLMSLPEALGDRLIAVTDRQENGRGRRGREWISPAGSSLALSMLAAPPVGMRWPARVSVALGLSAAEALTALGLNQVKLKWPNDLLVADRKLAGILVESIRGGAIVAGIGVNLTLDNETRTRIGQPCTDLQEAELAISTERLAAALIQAWTQELDSFFQISSAEMVVRWLRFDALIGREIHVNVGGEQLEAVACGIDDDGCLIAEVAGERRTYSSAEVSVRVR